MATRPLGTGYDPNSGWPSDDSTNIPYEPDVDLTGYGQFGPGGFAPNPRLTGPATGIPPGTSLSGPGGNAAAAAGPDIFPPQNSTIPNYKSVGPFTGGSATDAIIRGAARTLPRILRGRIPLADLVTPTDEIGGATGVELPRTLGRSPSGPGITRGPVPVNAPIPTPFTQPQHPSTMRYPMWPTPPAPATAAPTPPYRPEDSPSFTRPLAPAVPPVRPTTAGPAAAQQQPNLGNYASIYQPNIARTGNVRGGRSGDDNAPMMGALDLSRLFQRPQQ